MDCFCLFVKKIKYFYMPVKILRALCTKNNETQIYPQSLSSIVSLKQILLVKEYNNNF